MSIKHIILIIIILFPATVQSQTETKSLKACIEYAEQKNISIKQQIISAQIQHNNYKQSRLDLLPNLNAGSDYNLTFGRAVDPYTNEFTETNAQSVNMYANSSLTLFQGFRKQQTIKRNKFAYMASLQTTEQIKNDIALNIATAYLQILFNKELAEISEQQLELSREQLERMRNMVAAGKTAESELSNLLAQAANEEYQLVQAKNNLKDSYLLLYQLMDIRSDEYFEISSPAPDSLGELSIGYTLEELFQTAQSLPEIQAALYQHKAAEKDIEIAKSGYFPQLTVGVSYATGFSDARKLYEYGDSIMAPIGFVGNDGSIVYSMMPTYDETNYALQDQLKDNRNQSISFRLSIPIFNQWQVVTQVKNAELYAEQAELSVRQAENNLYKEIQTAYSQADAAAARYMSSQKAVEANRKAFSDTENRFKLGLVDATIYNQSKIQLTNSESDFLQSKYDFIFRKKILDFYAGKSLY